MESEKKQRSSVRKAITISINAAKGYMTGDEIAEGDESKLKGLAALLRTKLNVLDTLDEKIITTCEDDDDIEKETIETNKLSNEYLFMFSRD